MYFRITSRVNTALFITGVFSPNKEILCVLLLVQRLSPESSFDLIAIKWSPFFATQYVIGGLFFIVLYVNGFSI
jgi:ABC-type multidrug transport system permease subunit